MKKLKFLFTVIFIVTTISSCNLMDYGDIDYFDGQVDLMTVNRSKNFRGGNVDCSQIGFPDLAQTTGRNNYDPSLYGTVNGGFENPWPYGIEVVIKDGKIGWFIPKTFKIGDFCYTVGAVIVKGGDASNVYTYVGGATQDKDLVAPNNINGTPAGLSNLTFCFIKVECEQPKPIVISVKAFLYENGTDFIWAGSDGAYIFTDADWCHFLGINYYPTTSSFSLLKAIGISPRPNVGTISVLEAWPGGIHSLIVTVDLNDGHVPDKAYLYVGSLEGLVNPSLACPDYHVSPWRSDYIINGNNFVFTVPLE